MPPIVVNTINNMVFVTVEKLGCFAMTIEDAERFIKALQKSVAILKELKETGGISNGVGQS